MWQPSIHGDTVEDIWNGLQPPKVYYDISMIYPGFFFIALFTLVHVLLNRMSLSYAKKLAKTETHLNIPSVITSLLKKDEMSVEYIPKTRLKEVTRQLKNSSSSSSTTLTEKQQSELKNYEKQHKEYEKHVSKFQESLFKVIVFGFVYLVGLYVMFTGDFFWDSPRMWSHGMPQPINNVLIFYYSIQLGYHGHRGVYQFFEYARPDFWAMFIHHWIATILIAGSWMMGYIQVGSVLVMCNDNTDLIMPVAKLFGYLGYSRVKDAFGVLFLVTWFPLRIFLFPYKVIYSVLRIDGGYHHVKTNIFGWGLIALTFVIYGLQFYWSKLVLKVIYDMFSSGAIVDCRSDTEGTEVNKAKLAKDKKKQ